MLKHVFNINDIEKQLDNLKNAPKFYPEKYELRYTATQLFDTGIEVSFDFVVRNGEMIIYDSRERRV